MSDAVLRLDLPKTTIAGRGALASLAGAVRDLGARRVFVVSDRVVERVGLVERLLGVLEDSVGSGSVSAFAETEPEPTLVVIDRVADALRDAGRIDLLVSLGGGSVIDATKAANVLAMNGGSLPDYEDGADDPRPIARLLPHVAIPTTAGTGSEATAWAVFIDPARKLKNGVRDPRLIADVAILDPELTTTLPPATTAGTGMDALTHALEAYVSRYAGPLTDGLAAQAIALIARSLRRAVAEGDRLDARTDMLNASFLAGAAFSNSSCGLVHTLSEALGGALRVPHGATNGLLLAAVMEFNLVAAPAKYAHIATLLGEDVRGLSVAAAGAAAVDAVRCLTADIGLPRTLRELGAERLDTAVLAAAAAEWANESGNPRDATQAQLAMLLAQVQ